MTTNAVSKEPNPEAGRQNNTCNWSYRSDGFLIAVLTAIPILGLLAYWTANLLNPTEWTAFFTFVLAICTIVQAAIAKMQRETMVEQMGVAKTAADAAKDTVASMRQDQRAWLVVSKPEETIKPNGSGINVAIKIRNAGHSPAFICFQGGRLIEGDILAEEMPDEFKALMKHLYASQRIEVVLAPGDDEHTFHVHFPERYNSLAERGKELLPWNAISVMSGVVYLDSHGAEHYTTVCHRYVAYEEPPRFTGHRWHNNMT